MNADLTQPVPISRSERRPHARGFTLVELVVAMSAGMMVSMAAFMLSKSATNFFQHEARISGAQLSLTLGMNRLTSDIQRASYLSTRNLATDPQVCRAGAMPTGLAGFAGVQIKTSLSPPAQSTLNGLTPEQIVLSGSFDTSERFTVQCVKSGLGSVPLLELQTPQFDNAMARVLESAMSSVPAPATSTLALAGKLGPVFADGRYVSIFNPATGFSVYGVIGVGGFSVANNVVSVQLAAVPTVPTKPASPCGIDQAPQCGGGLLVSVLSRIKYDLRSLASTPGAYANLVTPISPTVTGDSGRSELVRVELAADGTEIPSTLELVSEYAVDLRFGLTVSSRIQGDNYNPTVTTIPITSPTPDPKIATIANDPSVSVTATPELIRSVQVRLATRTRAPDRDGALPVGPDGRMLRFLISPTLGTRSYARLRTSYAHVALPNQGGFSL